MRVIVWIAVALLLGFLGVQFYNLSIGNAAAKKELGKAIAEAKALAEENERLLADVEYYSEPENLAKEFRAKFDYKKPGEKLIKIQ